ncbi:hypothetical protein [Oceanospirillum beijerinckii]|uniref:hypothetical protein n=1 Tax=Oceanospirillum beijerinckii TaxID=64976 RepID=UPI00048410CC|nr:hypothetical protein [Oceanospirillum beijerinckii]
MTKYKSATSPELLETLRRWQTERNLDDAEFLADQIPHILEDVAMVKASFLKLREKVALLEEDTRHYKEGFHQRRILEDFDDSQKH